MTDALPNAATIGVTLAAIHASPEFARAPVMRHLLNYLVDETLAGRGDRLKAYSVAVDALGRNADFDAQADSYPRVQVGRLRRMLDAFYAQSPDVPLRIVIPLGAYRVQFSDRDAASQTHDHAPAPGPSKSSQTDPPADWRRPVMIAGGVALAGAFVLAAWALAYRPGPQRATMGGVERPPSISIEVGDAARRPTDRERLNDIVRQIATAFTRSATAEVAHGAAAVGAHYGLLLDLGTDGATLSMQLIDRETGTLEWSDSLTLPGEREAAVAALRPHISALVRPSGIIAAHQRIELRDDFSAGYPCLLQYGLYFRERDPALRQGVNNCIERTNRIDPSHAEALAAASFLAVDPVNGRPTSDARGRALELARRAAAADPSSPAPVVAEARIAFMDGNCVRARMLADRAVNLDDYDPETLGLIGMLLVGCDKERAAQLLRDARALDPELTTFYLTALILLEIDAGRAGEAAQIAGAMRPPGPGMFQQYQVAQVLGSIANGDDARARMLWQQVRARSPAPRDTVDQVLAHSYLAPDFRALIAARLARSGIGAAPPTRGNMVVGSPQAGDKATQPTGAMR